MASGREARHVGANFRNQRFSHACTNPGDGVEEVDGLGQNRIGTVLKLAVNCRGRAGDRLVYVIILVSQFLEEDALGWGQVACHGRLELRRRGLACPLGQRRECRGILFTVGKRLEHELARQAQHVGGDLAQLDMRRFQACLEPVGDRRAITDQDRPVTCQFPPFTAVSWRNAAGLAQTVAQQVTKPIAITHVRLPSRHSLDVLGVHEQDGQVVCQ